MGSRRLQHVFQRPRPDRRRALTAIDDSRRQLAIVARRGDEITVWQLQKRNGAVARDLGRADRTVGVGPPRPRLLPAERGPRRRVHESFPFDYSVSTRRTRRSRRSVDASSSPQSARRSRRPTSHRPSKAVGVGFTFSGSAEGPGLIRDPRGRACVGLHRPSASRRAGRSRRSDAVQAEESGNSASTSARSR